MALNLARVGLAHDPYPFEYDSRRLILYALGIGAGEGELQWTYEGDERFQAFPTFAVIPSMQALFDAVEELGADLTKLLHGEQGIRWHAPIPKAGNLLTSWKVTNVFDKGKGALAVVEARTSDAAGKPLFDNVISLFIRGEGGFGGDKGPEAPRFELPDRPADFRFEQATLPFQSLLYRLSGDYNRLHAEPAFARASGFEKPILHGLATLGFAARALVLGALGGDGARLKALSARFTGVVYPGDRLATEGWREGDKLLLRVTTDRGVTAISNFVAET